MGYQRESLRTVLIELMWVLHSKNKAITVCILSIYHTSGAVLSTFQGLSHAILTTTSGSVPVLRRTKWVSERLGHLPKVTELTTDGDSVQSRQCVSRAGSPNTLLTASLKNSDATFLQGSPNLLQCAHGHTGPKMDVNLCKTLKCLTHLKQQRKCHIIKTS